jgi:cell division protein ZapA
MSDIQGVEVNIMGRDLTIACPPEERDSLLNAVSYLNKKKESDMH